MSDANKKKAILEAEAQAEAVALKGEAEAFAIDAKAKAEAEHMAMKADAYKEYNKAARVCLKWRDFLPVSNWNFYFRLKCGWKLFQKWQQKLQRRFLSARK